MKRPPKKYVKAQHQTKVRQKVDPYKGIAHIYDKIFEPLNSGLRSIGMNMFPPGKGMKVLDVGCGTGVHLDLYQKAGCVVFGIDLSPSMLQVAHRRLGKRAHLFMGDASKMPYSGKTFDLVVISTVLHEMPGNVREAMIVESKRILKKNGRILLIDFHPGPIRPLKGWLYKCIITLAEVMAGREHYTNYRDFMANQGLKGLIALHELSIDKEKIVSGGNMALLLLRSGKRSS